MKKKQASPFIFDLFAPNIKVKVNGKDGVSTKVGTVISVLFLGAFVALGIAIISEYFNTKQPRVSQAIESTEFPPPISFSEDKVFPMLAFKYQASASIKKPDLDRFVTIEFTKISTMRDGTSSSSVTTFKNSKAVPCADLVNQGRTKSFVVESKEERASLINSGICVDPGDDDVTLGRKTDKEPYFQQIVWRILPCSLPSGCATREELAKVTFFTGLPRAVLNLANHKNPVRHITFAEETFYLSTAITSRQTINLLKTEIFDEAGFLTKQTLANSYSTVNVVGYSMSDRNPSQLTCSPADIASRSCIPYWIQNFVTSPQKMVIKRQYKGMVETFSELGGMVDMLFMLFFFPYTIYNSRVLREQLVEAVYGVKKPRGSRCCEFFKLRITVPDAVAGAEGSQAALSKYHLLFREAGSCLDIINILKDLETVKRILKSNGMSCPGLKDDLLDKFEDHENDHMVSGIGNGSKTIRIKPKRAGSGSPKHLKPKQLLPFRQKASIVKQQGSVQNMIDPPPETFRLPANRSNFKKDAKLADLMIKRSSQSRHLHSIDVNLKLPTRKILQINNPGFHDGM